MDFARMSHGESGMEFTVAPAGTPGSRENAGWTTWFDTPSMPTNDWSGHDYLVFDFWMPTDLTTSGVITIRDTHGVAWGTRYTIRGRRSTTIRIPLAEVTRAGVDVSSIRYFSASIPRQAEPVTGY
ncbi:hypothetical protein [Microlunatus sp. Y2014]|uniref:hypothetical protein n=1 Tax=Microlunatus sp. Y2014 TaxID=3418488 RepID=UPI003DA76F32